YKSYKLGDCLSRASLPHKQHWKNELDVELRDACKGTGLALDALKVKHGYEFVSVDTLGHYAVQDAVYELRLAEHQLPHTTHWKDLWDMEMRLFWVCVGMAWIGVPIDPEALRALAHEQQQRMADLAPQIWTLAGEQFEITNDTDLRRILFHKLGFASRGETKRGKVERVDDDVLWDLEVNEHSQIAKLVRQYNDADKVVSTYTLGVIDHADPHNILHAEIDQGGAKTGRTAMKSPNLQNVPIRTELGRRVRLGFPARPGKIRYCMDFSQAEMRVLADRSQDPILLKVYRQGLDAHRTTALEVFGTAEMVDGMDMRRLAKIINFGTSFGMTEIGFMKNVNKDLPAGQVPITEVAARKFLADFYRKYAGIDRYRRNLWDQIRQANGLFFNMFGRPRHLPAINSTRDWEREAAERQATSTMVQG
ncbi:MAG: DNA polymerase A family protein, partial [Terriglobales bacterium]